MKSAALTLTGADGTAESHSALARARLLSLKDDPFLFANWERVVFLHYLIAPEVLRPPVPEPFELELHEGKACVSLVALTMRHFRPCRPCSLVAWPFRPIARQCFLNVRTYVRWGDEPGALFLQGWLSKPFGIGAPLSGLGLPCGFGSLEYGHGCEGGVLSAVVKQSGARGFAYHATIEPHAEFQPCEPGSLAAFAMERYSGFFCWGNRRLIFRVWHPPWLQKPLEATVEEDSLLRGKFPWFKEAKLAGANFAPGFERVWLGRAHRLETVMARRASGRRVLSAFYEMP